MLAQATGREAKTIHRLLEYSPGEGGFQRGAARPLEAEFIVIDEVSMVDISLMHYLLSAIHPQSSLILVGDADQLPSVGPGNVLGDWWNQGKSRLFAFRLFSGSKASLIIENAHLVNAGKLPQKQVEGYEPDFYMIEKEDPDEVLRIIKEIVCQRIPTRFGFDPWRMSKSFARCTKAPLERRT